MAIDVTLNAKMRRTSICGATETILCHKKVVKSVLPSLINKLIKSGCKVKAEREIKHLNKNVFPVKKEDWSTRIFGCGSIDQSSKLLGRSYRAYQ